MKRPWRRACLGLLAAMAAAPVQAQAQGSDCAPPRYVTGVPLTPDASNTMMVPVTLNGVPENMLLDTGGVISEISRATLDAFDLPEQKSRLQVFDVRGSVSRTITEVDALGLGGLDLSGVKLQVNTDPVFGPAFAGVISNDLLAPYDVDLDFGSNRLNLFTPGNCDGARVYLNPVYWPAKTIAVVPFDYSGGHISLPVMLDGHLLLAVLDTGASITALSLEAADRLYGLGPDSPGMAVSQQSAGNDSHAKIYTHAFSQMTFEGVKVNHPLVMIIPVRLNGADSRWHPRRWRNRPPDLIIGMEVLRTLHIYVAFQERKLYVTRADTAAASLLPAVADPPSPSAISAIQP